MIRHNFISLLCQFQTAANMGLVCKNKNYFFLSYILVLNLVKSQECHSDLRGRCSKIILLLRHLCHLNPITFIALLTEHPLPFSRNFLFFLLSLQGVSYELQERHFPRRGQWLYFCALTNPITKDRSSFCFLFPLSS